MPRDSALGDTSAMFATFAARECRGSSPLYARISADIAGDDFVLRLMLEAPESQRRPNLLLGAVHYLLLRGADHDLREVYPSVVGEDAKCHDPWRDFRRFCEEHQQAIREILATRRTQTNEVRRCAHLFPIFAELARFHPDRPLALLEVGASAGLNLNLDRYCYEYGRSLRAGDLSSSVRITSEVVGPLPTSVQGFLPRISHRVGIDLNPIDVSDEDSALWLRALVWPEHTHRAELLRSAIDLTRDRRPELVEGDAVETLQTEASRIPSDSHLCIFHTNTMPYMSRRQRLNLADAISEIGRERDVSWICGEEPGIVESLSLPIPREPVDGSLPGTPVLNVYAFVRHHNEQVNARMVLRGGGHGDWTEWLQDLPRS